MQDLKSILTAAAGDGVITAEAAERLAPYLAARGVRVETAAENTAGPLGNLFGGLSAPRDGEAEEPAFESEAPRFVRGFHDVLITIGIIIAMVGVWGIGSYFAALPVILILAEVLVRRQRLALPAVALSIAFVQWIAVVAALVIGDFEAGLDAVTHGLLFLLPFPLALAPFTWRYRVPLALAMLIVSVCLALLALVFLLLQKATGSANFFLDHRLAASAILLVAALCLFALAMRFDLADPLRRSRRSDVAFWLHLAAAPALLYAMLAFVFLDDQGFTLFSERSGSGDAIAVVLIVILFMGIGLIIDRRAFVTSGLLSLGFAIFRIFQQANLTVDTYGFVTLVIVGLVVLTIGVGWPWFRRSAFSLLPGTLKTKLPPLR